MAKQAIDETNVNAPDVEDDFDVLSESGEESLIFNLEDFEAPKFQVAPAGIYEGTVKTIELRESKAGNEMWVWQIEAPDTPVGKRVFFNHMVFRKKNLETGRMEYDLRGIGTIQQTCKGIQPEYDYRNFDLKNSFHDFISLPCRVKVAVGKYNGEDTNNVKEILPPDQGIDGFLS